jgi:hypothetical protein
MRGNQAEAEAILPLESVSEPQYAYQSYIRTHELNTIVQAVKTWIRLSCAKNEYLTMNVACMNNGWKLCHKFIHGVAKVKTYVHHYSIATQSLQSRLAVKIPPAQWKPVDFYTLQWPCILCQQQILSEKEIVNFTASTSLARLSQSL